jgi:uncharacterized protein involved in exopolysaccharide biosynthesis
MQTTEADPDDDKKSDDVIRSLRFKKHQWDALEKHVTKHRIKMAAFLRNAALRAAGYQTEVDGMRNTATALAQAVDSVAVVEDPAKPAKKPAKPKRR